MSPSTTRRLLAVHRICGLIVSLNMALFALTGVILIFHEEIDSALGVLPTSRTGDATISLAQAVALTQKARPTANVLYVFRDPAEMPGMILVGTAVGSHKLEAAKPAFIDASSGSVLEKIDIDGSFTNIVLRLHAQLLMGPGGGLLVGFIGLILLASLITGIVIYGPMMRRFAFGLLRRDRQLRTVLADLHKLMGVASFGWTLVVVSTGILLSLGSMLLQLYTMTELAELGAPYAHQPPVSDYSTVDQAAQNAERASGGRRWSLIAMPGSDFASPRHYAVLLHGHEGLDQRMLTMGLVDAVEPDKVQHREFPWYLRALLVAEPLHFGDYGGLPLKLLWLAFTLITLAMTVSGVFVSISTFKNRALRKRSDALDAEAELAP